MSRDLKEVKEGVPGFPWMQKSKCRDSVYLTSPREVGVLVAQLAEARVGGGGQGGGEGTQVT